MKTSKYVNRIIFVGFASKDVSSYFLEGDIKNTELRDDGSENFELKGYQYAMAQLYNNNGVFFDDIFNYIHSGIQRHNCIELSIRESTYSIFDCYPLLITRLGKLLNTIGNNIIIINKGSRYKYLCDILDIEKYEYNSIEEAYKFISSNKTSIF